MRLAGKVHPAAFLYHSLWTALDWIFPPACGGCGKTGVRWCEACIRQSARIQEPVCVKCGTPRHPEDEPVCATCVALNPVYQAVRSYAEFAGPIRTALHKLKYKGDIGLGEALSKHLIELYNQNQWDIDIIAPVPLSAARMQERGYNQAGLLARPIAYALQKPFRPEILERARETRSQVGLSARERQQNVAGAFRADGELVRGKTVLVVDDVTTTGSTIDACSQALSVAGALAVYGLTFARAVLQNHADDRPTPTKSNGGKNGT